MATAGRALPKEFRVVGDEVQIKRVGAGVVRLPTPPTYEQVMAVIERFQGAIERQQPEDQDRQWRRGCSIGPLDD